MPDNGAINQGSAVEGSCPTCEETPSVQCGIESAAQQCSTPFCDPRLGSLPKKTAARLLMRNGECLADNPTVPTAIPQVWQRGLDGIDRIAPLTSAMIPVKADVPCFTTVNEATANSFGKALMAEVDSDSGKTCIKQVTLEGTDRAYLAGLAAEDVCSGTPGIRPVRIIPEDISGCPDNIRFLAATDVTEEIQPGLNRVRTVWKWVKNIIVSLANLIDYEGGDDAPENTTIMPAAWAVNGDCASLVAMKADGKQGLWAMCGGSLKFFELPKDGDGNYKGGFQLRYVGGDSCWEWQESLGFSPRFQLLYNDTTSLITFSWDSFDLPNVASGQTIYAEFSFWAAISGPAGCQMDMTFNGSVLGALYTGAGSGGADSDRFLHVAPVVPGGNFTIRMEVTGSPAQKPSIVFLNGFRY